MIFRQEIVVDEEMVSQDTVAAEKRASQRAPRVFATTIFLSAALLFQIQLLIGKQILPWFGGAAAVWNTCMVVYQALLLSGYAYSHLLVSRYSPRNQYRIHSLVVVASMAALGLQIVLWHQPILPAETLRVIGPSHPILNILFVLTSSVGLPFFVLSTTGPLVQSWFARILPETSPYRLYAKSNAGSLLGLVSYPFVLEWVFHLKTQAWLWSAGYLAFASSILALAKRVSRVCPAPPLNREIVERTEPFKRGQFLLWIGLSACPSAMMLAATGQISSDIPPMPFLWMLPLMLYLLTLMICFDSEKWFQRVVIYPLHFLTVTGIVLFNAFTKGGTFQIVLWLYCLAVFTTGMVAHGELVRLKPTSKDLTSFYLAMAIGGVLGGTLVGLVAPVVFRDTYEFRIIVAATLLLLALVLLKDSKSWLRRGSPVATTALFLGVLLMALVPKIRAVFPWPAAHSLLYLTVVVILSIGVCVVFLRRARQASGADRTPVFLDVLYLVFLAGIGAGSISHSPLENSQILLTERNFFGVKRVARDDLTVVMIHGSTLHGLEFNAPSRRDEPTSYYSYDSGVALLLRNFPRKNNRGLRVGLVGLGVGTLATYAKPGDVYRFYEIDPQVVSIAQGQNSYFHFLEDSQAQLEFVGGDGRICLETEALSDHRQHFDVLILDAFSGDSIPMHLLTREAMRTYLQHLQSSRSVMAVHITNRYIDLKPVLSALAQEFHLQIAYLPAKDSHWVLLAQDKEVLTIPEIKRATFNSFLDQKPVLWTDDYSNLLPLI
jgi:spermidine synthase